VIEITAGAKKDGTLTAWESAQLELGGLGLGVALRSSEPKN